MMVKPYKTRLTISKPERHTTAVRYGLLEGLARRSVRCLFLQCDWPRRSSHRLARDYPLTSGPLGLHLKGIDLLLVTTPVPILSPATAPIPIHSCRRKSRRSPIPIHSGQRRHGFVGRWRGIFHRSKLCWQRCKWIWCDGLGFILI